MSGRKWVGVVEDYFWVYRTHCRSLRSILPAVDGGAILIDGGKNRLVLEVVVVVMVVLGGEVMIQVIRGGMTGARAEAAGHQRVNGEKGLDVPTRGASPPFVILRLSLGLSLEMRGQVAVVGGLREWVERLAVVSRRSGGRSDLSDTGL